MENRFKKIKIIANPLSGREEALDKVLEFIRLLSLDQWDINLLFTHKRGDGMRFAETDDGEDIIVACGGDGTLNEVVNGIVKSKRDTPLAILQAGTVNDFANYFKLPQDPSKFYKLIKEGRTKKIDVGLAGDRVFANVAAGGMLTEIAYTVPEDQKAVLGRMAYYLEGAKQMVKLNFQDEKAYKVKIDCEEYKGEENLFFFLITNTSSVGGFKKMAPAATVTDGYLDVLLIKECSLVDFMQIAPLVLTGAHIDHEKVIYLKTKEISLSSDIELDIDVDGEQSGKLPMKFKVLEEALTIII